MSGYKGYYDYLDYLNHTYAGYPSLYKFLSGTPGLTATKTKEGFNIDDYTRVGDVWNLNYDRTNRDLGSFAPSIAELTSGKINPTTAQTYIDVVDLLNQVDPNRYHYDLSGQTTQALQTPLTSALEKSSAINPTATQLEAEKIQQARNPLHEALSMILGSY